jgi:predicted DNA-binding transcriptional regulator AlpA
MRLLTFRELRAEKGHPYSRRHTERLVAQGKFPRPIKLGDGRAGRTAWDETVYDGYIAAKRDRATVADDHQAVV